jgi:hypothetical protein
MRVRFFCSEIGFDDLAQQFKQRFGVFDADRIFKTGLGIGPIVERFGGGRSTLFVAT